MRTKLFLTSAAALAFSAPSIAAPAFAPALAPANTAANVSVYATGFNNPRGLTFGPDHMLYVAEGGPGGGKSTVGACQQVPSPVGPYTGAAIGGRISRVGPDRIRRTLTQNFPSSQTSSNLGNLVSGVADVKFIGATLYALTAGSGCSHGVWGTVNGIFRVNPNGDAALVADLSAFLKAHPVAHPNPGDFEPEGTWYSMIAVDGALFAVEPNHGEVDRINQWGVINRVSDISASQGHIVPTAIAFHSGNLYVGNLNTFPITPGSSKVLAITGNGGTVKVVGGLTTIVGLTFDGLGRMYVLENTVKAGNPTPGYGKIVRISGGKQDVIASGLSLPTAMTFGPDGALYVSNWGFGPPPTLPNGPGQVLRITVPK